MNFPQGSETLQCLDHIYSVYSDGRNILNSSRLRSPTRFVLKPYHTFSSFFTFCSFWGKNGDRVSKYLKDSFIFHYYSTHSLSVSAGFGGILSVTYSIRFRIEMPLATALMRIFNSAIK